MKMLSWMSGNILKYQVKNENIQEKLRGSNKKVKRERDLSIMIWSCIKRLIDAPM